MGFGGAIEQSFHALREEAIDPFGYGLGAGVELSCCGGLAKPLIHYGSGHVLSTFRRQTSILVRVHSVPRESLVVWRLQRSRSGPNGQPPESSQLRRHKRVYARLRRAMAPCPPRCINKEPSLVGTRALGAL